MINSVTLAGNLTRDPELRTTQNGTAVLNFSIAVNDRRKDEQTGEWRDRPNYFDCVMFGRRAEAVAPYLFKGTYTVVMGSLRYSSWEKDGQKRSKDEIVVSDIDFKNNNGAQPAHPPSAVGVFEPQESVYDNDIPF